MDAKGYRVLATDRIDDEAGVYDDFIRFELREESSIRSLVDWCEALGGASALVNNAAVTNPVGRAASHPVSFVSLTDFFLVNAAAPLMLALQMTEVASRKKPLRIVNLGSIYGLVGPSPEIYEGAAMALRPEYVASKGALHALTRYLATTLGDNALVNAVAPGGIQRDQPRNFVDRYCDLVPVGRMCTEDDVARVVVWLLSEENLYVTGQIICVDGGWTSR